MLLCSLFLFSLKLILIADSHFYSPPLESEEALLKMSTSQPESGVAALPDFSSMTEEEQIAYAMQMSLAGGGLCLPLVPC